MSAYKKAVEQLTSFILDGSLQGAAYDSAKAYAQGSLNSLLAGAQLYTEKVAEMAQKIADKYLSEVGEDLNEDDLKNLIQSMEAELMLERVSMAIRAASSPMSVLTQSAHLSKMSTIESEISKLQEKLTKLQNFSATSDSVRSELSALGEAVVEGYRQVSADITDFVESQQFPGREVQGGQKNILRAAELEQTKSTASKEEKIEHSDKKSNRLVGSVNSVVKSSTAENYKIQEGMFYSTYSTAGVKVIKNSSKGMLNFKTENKHFSGLQLDLKVISFDLDFSEGHVNFGAKGSLFGYNVHTSANVGFNSEIGSLEAKAAFGTGENGKFDNDFGFKISSDIDNGILGAYVKRTKYETDGDIVTASSYETGFQTLNRGELQVAMVIGSIVLAPETGGASLLGTLAGA